MPINSRQKGASGEREFAKWLTERGYPSHRGRQFHGRDDAPDVKCDSLPIHWEVKRVEKLNLQTAVAQSRADCGDKLPVVAHRRNGEGWLITMSADEFFRLFVREVFPVGQTKDK